MGVTILVKMAAIAPAAKPKNRVAPMFYMTSQIPPTMIPPVNMLIMIP